MRSVRSAVAAGFLAASIAGAQELRKEVIKIKAGDETVELQASDLAEGETRTFDEGGKRIAITRSGDSLEVTVDGKPIGGKLPGRVLVRHESEAPAGGEVQKRVFLMHADGSEHLKVHVGDGEAMHLEGLPPDVLDRLHESSVYRCPEDETEVRIRKEHASGEAPLCPLDGRPMEKIEARKLAVYGYRFETDAQKTEKQD
jgi:hypothetical protein